MATRVIFIAGTDTGVGKTAVTGLAAAHLAARGANFRAVKPFCSGERTDAVLLRDLQDGVPPLDEINPYFFDEPIAPWTAARKSGRRISRTETVRYLRQQARGRDWLLVEGAGGLLAPLGERFNAADLIVDLRAEVILVAANRLGVLNHTLLSVEALRQRNAPPPTIALVHLNATDAASSTNEEDLRLLLPHLRIISIPFLPGYKPERGFITAAAGQLSIETLFAP